MTQNGWLQILLFFCVVLVTVKPMGIYMARVFQREHTFLDRLLSPVERFIYKATHVDPSSEMRWTEYSVAMLLFSAASLLLTYFMERVQQLLPLNPQKLAAVAPDLAFNTAASFTTNTNWQAYTPESTMSYLTQMAGLATHNFFSAAAGMALAIAFIRGISRRESKTIGNFWVDMTRAILWVLLPICLLYSVFLVSQGVVQNFRPYDQATVVEPQRVSTTGADGKPTTQIITTQTIAQGPVASQEAIKMLGTNGGGFFNANSAHPFENPTPLSNFVEMLSIFLIPAGFTATLGRLTGSPRHGWAVFAAMAVLFFAGVLVAYSAESRPNPLLHGVDQHTSALQAGGNMEGKEVRFGIANSALFTTVTTDASCGAINNQHDSLMPLGGLIPMVNIQLGEVIFGGVGSGLYGILLFAIIAVFVAGLMVGRTPEYLGKKIEAKDVKMAMLALLILPFSILGFTALASVLPQGLAGIANQGPHGFSEMLYAYTSATGNNGSAFAGISANTMFYDTTLGAAMLIGRFLMIVPMLAVAGSLVTKKIVPPSSGTFPTDGPLFVGLVVGVILIMGGLTYFPALSLGPIVEHFAMLRGASY
jgi:potassium-transporting ATPase potassium-binding subunit